MKRAKPLRPPARTSRLMPHRRHRSLGFPSEPLVRQITHALDADPVREDSEDESLKWRQPLLPLQVDVSTLRFIAVHHGLVNHALRARVWPKLLGIEDEKLRENYRGAHILRVTYLP